MAAPFPKVSDSVDWVWGLRMCFSSKAPGEAADAVSMVGSTRWEPVALGIAAAGGELRLPKEELVPFLAPVADAVWAGQCCDPSRACPSSALPTTPGSVGESVGVLLVVTVFGSTDGMDMEGAEVVLAMKDFQNPVLSDPLRNIEMHYLFFPPNIR